jgi:hypothetical protein
MGTAYQFYGVKECTEPAGNLDAKAFVRRMFSDASAGAAQLFSYQFEEHAANIQKYVHLFTGKSGDTEIAVYSPTTLYRLGENLQPTIKASAALRDLCEFDVLDELLIADGALTTKRYKALILFQAETVDQPILNKMASFLRHGGKIIAVGNLSIKNVEGQPWPSSSKLKHLPLPKGAGRGEGESDVHQPASSNLGKGSHKNQNWLPDLSSQLAGLKGVDGQVDGLWTCRRGKQVFLFNSTTNTIETKPDGKPITVPAYTIWNGP